MDRLRPKDGHVIELDAAEYEAIGELLGFDFEEELEEADPIIGEELPAVIIGGDLHFDRNMNSKDLAKGLKGFTGEHSDEGHWVVVLGNLTVNGNLIVEQCFDLMVSGTVNVHSYISHSANFVSPSHLTARDVILTEANEEGGIFQPRSASAKAVICTNYYFDDAWELTAGEVINADELNGTDVERARCAVFKVLDKPQAEGSLWFQFEECIEAGKIDAFLDAYEKDER